MKVSTFKDRFSELFEESKMTTTQLGKELHVSEQTISAWKVGARSPKEPTIIMIANYFHVNVRWLMGFDVDRERPKMKFPDYTVPLDDSIGLKMLEERIERSAEDEELRKLWPSASTRARRAALAVLQSMKEGDE